MPLFYHSSSKKMDANTLFVYSTSYIAIYCPLGVITDSNPEQNGASDVFIALMHSGASTTFFAILHSATFLPILVVKPGIFY